MRRGFPFLRIPPFPGHRAPPLAREGANSCDPDALITALRQARVGGCFWGRHSPLPIPRGLVLAPDSAAQLKEMMATATLPIAAIVAPASLTIPADTMRLPGDCDPWHLADCAGVVWAGAEQELALVAAIAGKSVRLFGVGAMEGCDTDPASTTARIVGAWRYVSPFDGSEWTALEAIDQLGEWRRLIDANRAVAAVVGIAAWKRVTLNPLLWNGAGRVPHCRLLPAGLRPQAHVVVWKSRTPSRLLARLEASGVTLGEVEDGFIRSSGLGANCVPPLSAIVDFSGVYFDPLGPSDLENLLEYAEIDSITRARAERFRRRLIEAAISKYSQGGITESLPKDGRRRILVAGQVEDDRSILSGGKGLSNLDLLERARGLEADAWIIYKPHPDVKAGHRKGHVPEREALKFADEIVRDAPITALIDSVDGLHVITSLAGFEALLRGKQVTTHGVPFYAGWGLTRDLGEIPARRTRRRSLDELVAATLLLYPRYLDPVTRLPCPAEILVERMAKGEAKVSSPLVALREWQGRIKALWQRAAGGR